MTTWFWEKACGCTRGPFMAPPPCPYGTLYKKQNHTAHSWGAAVKHNKLDPDLPAKQKHQVQAPLHHHFLNLQGLHNPSTSLPAVHSRWEEEESASDGNKSHRTAHTVPFSNCQWNDTVEVGSEAHRVPYANLTPPAVLLTLHSVPNVLTENKTEKKREASATGARLEQTDRKKKDEN
ncbi:hypothetical protein AGIG_G18192 [Arapaima gigas]